MTKTKSAAERYHELILKATTLAHNRVLIGIPMTGTVRAEWAVARYAQIIPCNWSQSDCIQFMSQCTPLGYAVAEARNVMVDRALAENFEWLFFIDHDVVLPPDALVKINEYIVKGDIPVVAGLYYAKCHPPSPLIYRGRGNGHFAKWKMGDKVWADGIPMGCTLMHMSIFRAMAKDAPLYVAGGNRKVKKIFDTPFGVWFDSKKNNWNGYAGTEDLAWCNRVIAGKYLAKAGWPTFQQKKYPFLIDTSLFCRHIDPSGQQYPLTSVN